MFRFSYRRLAVFVIFHCQESVASNLNSACLKSRQNFELPSLSSSAKYFFSYPLYHRVTFSQILSPSLFRKWVIVIITLWQSVFNQENTLTSIALHIVITSLITPGHKSSVLKKKRNSWLTSLTENKNTAAFSLVCCVQSEIWFADAEKHYPKDQQDLK